MRTATFQCCTVQGLLSSKLLCCNAAELLTVTTQYMSATGQVHF